MTIICIEDGFEHNIEQAMKDVMNGHETIEDFLEDVDGGQAMANALYERAYEYLELTELAKKLWEEKNDK